MAKREISSTLKNLKFMQRAAVKEEKTKKVEEEVVIADDNFSSSNPRKCVVIMEGDPHPGVLRGRMSFQSFNPSVDKLNEEACNVGQPDGSTTSSGDQGGGSSSRENGTARDDLEMETHDTDAGEDLKRKQAEVISEVPNPSKTQKNSHGHQEPPSSNRSTHKKHKREKLDWNVLRPPKPQNRQG